MLRFTRVIFIRVNRLLRTRWDEDKGEIKLPVSRDQDLIANLAALDFLFFFPIFFSLPTVEDRAEQNS